MGYMRHKMDWSFAGMVRVGIARRHAGTKSLRFGGSVGFSVVVFACVSLGCGGNAGTEPKFTKGLTTHRPPPKPEPWKPFAAAQQWPKAHTTRFRSQGHFNASYFAEVRTAPQTSRRYLEPSSAAFTEGDVITMSHYAASGAQHGPLFVMEYQSEQNDWRYLQVDLDGNLAERERERSCHRCHTEAPHTSLFGLPEDANPLAVSTDNAETPDGNDLPGPAVTNP